MVRRQLARVTTEGFKPDEKKRYKTKEGFVVERGSYVVLKEGILERDRQENHLELTIKGDSRVKKLHIKGIPSIEVGDEITAKVDVSVPVYNGDMPDERKSILGFNYRDKLYEEERSVSELQWSRFGQYRGTHRNLLDV